MSGDHTSPTVNALLHTLASPALPGIRLGIERVAALLERLGNPHLALPPVVHIAGTNGKGSTLAFLTAICEAADLRVHRYTSPHLVRFNERIYLAGRDITDEELIPLLKQVQAVARDTPATYFEATTAAAFLAFRQVPADIVLLETGLGGRLDATNAIPHPALTLFSPIGMDHQEFLGDSLTSIATEKAGILKAGTPALTAPQTPEAMAVLRKEAARLGITLKQADSDFSLPDLPLAGAHQHINARLAAAAAKRLATPPSPVIPAQAGVHTQPRISAFAGMTTDIIRTGLQQARWPARLQRLTHPQWLNVLPKESELWLDGSHNPDGAKAVTDWLATRQDGKPASLITGMMGDKDSEGYFSEFKQYIRSIYCIPVTGEPRACPPDRLAAIAGRLGIPAKPADSVTVALQMISTLAAAQRIVICGSLYLAGSVLAEVEKPVSAGGTTA